MKKDRSREHFSFIFFYSVCRYMEDGRYLLKIKNFKKIVVTYAAHNGIGTYMIVQKTNTALSISKMLVILVYSNLDMDNTRLYFMSINLENVSREGNVCMYYTYNLRSRYALNGFQCGF